MKIQIKRIYLPYSTADGTRILADKLWPRGVSKENAKLDGWWKIAAPSTELRKWFDHKPERWDHFYKEYLKELAQKETEIDELINNLDKRKPLTLLYAATDPKHNHALVLKSYLKTNYTLLD